MKKPFKKIVFRIILICLIAIVIELVSVAVFFFLNNNSLSKKEIYNRFISVKNQNKNIDISSSVTKVQSVRDDVIHPYLGFVKDYDIKEIHHNDDVFAPINKYGFIGDFPKNDNSIKIAILGGSVAEELFLYSNQTFINELKQSQSFKNKSIEVASIALGGMKQPQQLMALNYFLSIGKSFDIVINLDGFNEIALPACENIHYGISPFYPRAYSVYSAKAYDARTLYFISQVVGSKMKIIEYGNKFFSSAARYSHFLSSLWIIFTQREEAKQNNLNNELKNIFIKKAENNKLSYQEKGPNIRFRNADEIFIFTTELWRKTSLLMHQIATENDMQYYHFLQPNQYVKDSKTLSDWEKKNAIANSEYCYRKVVEMGYPSLLDHGETLKSNDVNFHDLTGIYKEIPYDIYKDNCCHYNQQGNDLLAKEMARIIINNQKEN